MQYTKHDPSSTGYLCRCWDDQHATRRSWRAHSEWKLVSRPAHGTRTIPRRRPFVVDVRPRTEGRNTENDRQSDHDRHLSQAHLGGSGRSPYGLVCYGNWQRVSQILASCNSVAFAFVSFSKFAVNLPAN